ncbi:MAG: hypothetical protein R2729_20400 [Bryobacteraceae bacterium]
MTIFKRGLSCLLLAAAATSFPAAAQPVMNIGLTRIALDGGKPGSIFVSTGRGLMRSADGGVRYEPLAIRPAGQPQPVVTAFLIQPSNPKNLFLGSDAEDGGFWKSSDGGDTWAIANMGLPESGVSVILLQWVESNQSLYARVGGQVYKSIDLAETWSLLGDLPPQVVAFAISPSDPRWMYAAQASGGLFRSRDEGVTWTINRNTVPGFSGTTTVTDMVVDPKNPGVGYLAASGPGAGLGNGIYKSGDLNQEEGWAFGLIESTRERLRPVRLYFNGLGNLFATSRIPGRIYRSRCDLVSNATDATIRCFDPSVGFDQICVNPDPNNPPGACNASRLVNDLAIDPAQPEVMWAASANGIFQSRPSLSTGVGAEWSSRYGLAKATLAAPEHPFAFRLPAGFTGRLRLRVGTAESDEWRIPATVTPGGETWLSVTPAADRTPADLTVNIGTAGLEPGMYTSKIEVRAADTVNSPLEVPVVLEVLEPARSSYTLSTVAGLGVPGNFGDNGPATRAAIGEADSLALDNEGNLYYSDLTYNLIRRIDPSGRITRWAGTGVAGTAGDDGPPALAQFRRPRGLATDRQNRLWVADGEARRIRRVSADGSNIAAVATIGENLRGLAVDGNGAAFVAVPIVHAIAKVAPDGQLTVAAGTGVAGFRGEKTPARTARLAAPLDVTLDPSGNLFIADTENNRIRRIDPEGTITTVAGNGLAGYQGDADKATETALDRPSGIATDGAGNIYFTETEGHRVRMVTASGALVTIAGTGNPGAGGAGPASAAALRAPTDVAVAADGSVLISDSLNYRIIRLTPLVASGAPQLSADPIVNSVDGRPGLAPGSLFRLSGRNLAADAAGELPYPTSLGDAQVLINGAAAPLARTTPGEIVGQIPYEASPGMAKVRVVFKGKESLEAEFRLQEAAPALVANGGNRVLAIHTDGSANGDGNGALAGSEIRIFITGQGAANPAVPSGEASPAEPFSRPVGRVRVTIGGDEAQVVDAILLPGFAGLAEIRAVTPGALAAGDHEVIVYVGESASGRPLLRVARP